MSKELRDQLWRELAFFREKLEALGDPGGDFAAHLVQGQLEAKIAEIESEIKGMS